MVGSGIPPSATQRFDSYLVRIKFSILLRRYQYMRGGNVVSISIRFRRYMSRCQFSFPVSMINVRYDPSISDTHYAHLFALALPHFSTLWSCSSVQVSRSTDLTLLMCVPMPRCMPEHLYTLLTQALGGMVEGERIPNAHEDTQIPAGPSWICGV